MFVTAALCGVAFFFFFCFVVVFLLKLFCNHGFPGVQYQRACEWTGVAGGSDVKSSHLVDLPSVSQPCFQEPLWELSLEPLVPSLT